MKEELYIEGKRFDIGDKSIAQTFQVNDLADLKDRRANVSNTIKAPYTPNNIAILNYLGIIGSQSRAPYQKLRAKYIVGGIEVIPNGFAQIKACDTVIELVIYSGNISLTDRLEGKQLNDLDFSDLNHYLNLASFISGMDRIDGYVYGIGNFGIYPPLPGTMRIEWQLPSVFFSTIWDKIFTQSGATYSGAVFEDESFLSEVLAPAKGPEIDEEGIVVEETYTPIGTVETNAIDINEFPGHVQSYERRFSLSSSIPEVEIIDNDFLKFTVEENIRLRLNINALISEGRGFITVERNGRPILNHEITNSAPATIDVNIASNTTDIYSFHLIGISEPQDPQLPIYRVIVGAQIDINIDSVQGGIYIDIQELMPKLSQTEFLKDVMQRYGLIFRSKGNHYEFIRIEDLLNDRENSEDWSDKLKVEQGENYEFGSFAKNNLFKYNYDDEITEFLQNGNLKAENENLTADKEMFTSAFTISESTHTNLNRNVYLIPLWEGKFDEDTGELLEVKSKEVSPRIFKVERIPGTINVRFLNGSSSQITGDIPFLSLEDLQMNFYISRYYKAFNRILNAPKVRKDMFYLDVFDIQKLDFFRLKYFKQRAQYFYLNKVESYIPGETVRCELIQVVGISKGIDGGNQSPTQLGIKIFTIFKGGQINLRLNDFLETNPPYFDPEYDAPEQIKIVSFGIPHTRIFNSGMEVTSETIVDANDFNLVVKDLGLTSQAHTARFGFKIQSYNNPNFSDVTGELVVNVLEHVNQAPIADAGVDINKHEQFPTWIYEITLNGCNSYDPDGDEITYFWELIDAPAGVYLDDVTTCTPNLSINVNGGLGETFYVKLTVEDPEGLTDTDQIKVTLTASQIPDPNG